MDKYEVHLKEQLKKLIYTLNYDLSEYERIYSYMEYALDLNEKFNPTLIDRLTAIKLIKLHNKKKKHRKRIFKEITKAMKDGRYSRFHFAFYNNGYTLYDLQEIDANTRYEIMSLTKSFGAQRARYSIKLLYEFGVEDTKDLINIATAVYTFLENHQLTTINDILTYEDIKNLA